jgi:hypothetical protein
MEQISIVKKRSRVLPVVITLLIVALLILAALYVIGDVPAGTV